MNEKPNDAQPYEDIPEGLDFVPKFGLVLPAELRFSGVPAFDEANDVLPESEWEEHDDLADFWPQIMAQANNNCTCASLAQGAEASFKAAGVPNVPHLSWGFNYTLRNGGRDEGAMCRDLAIDSKGIGLCPAALVSDSAVTKPRGGYGQDVLTAAAEWQFLEIYQCLNWQHVGSALSERFIVYHGFCLGRSGLSASADGRVPEYDGSTANGHAMVSRGLTRKFGEMRTITPNTWGTRYGLAGIGFWPKSYFWDRRGNFVNLDAYALRAVRRRDPLPPAAE